MAPEGAGLQPAISRDAVASLPAAVRAELYQAVVSLDGRRIARAVEKVAEHDDALARALSSYAERYSYTPILNAVDFGDQKRSLSGCNS